jgi:hypothetical protein
MSLGGSADVLEWARNYNLEVLTTLLNGPGVLLGGAPDSLDWARQCL